MFANLMDINTPEDREKFNEIYLIYRNRMYYAAYSILKNKMDAEDIVHDAFLKLIDNLDKINKVGCHMTWHYIVAIVKNLSLDFLKKEKRYEKVVYKDYMEGGDRIYEGVESAILQKEMEAELAKAISGLQHPYKEVDFRFFIEYYDENSIIQKKYGEKHSLSRGNNEIQWKIPVHCGQAIYRLSMELTSNKRLDGSVTLKWLDWSGAPERYELAKSYEMTPSLVTWTNETIWLKTFLSSAKHFYPDYLRTFSISHPDKNGVITTGGPDWKDYKVSSKITFSHQEGAGLVARAKGHRRYYAAIFQEGKAKIICRKDWEVIELASVEFEYKIDAEYKIDFTLNGNDLLMAIDGEIMIRAVDGTYSCGGAGFLVDKGAILGDGFLVEKCYNPSM